MSDTVRETIQIECSEEKRTATLLVRWEVDGDERRLVSVQCDNPKFHSIDNWECHWSCWDRVRAAKADAE